MRNAGIRLFYPNSFGQTAPNEARTISSWVNDKAISVKLDVTDNRAVGVKCYVPEYTFVEKLQTISTKFRRQQEKGDMPVNFMRHYYDLFQLLKLQRVQKFIGSAEYLEHKNKRFRLKDEPDLLKNEGFIISDPWTKNKYEMAFLKTKNLYYKGQPSLDSVLKEFAKWLGKL